MVRAKACVRFRSVAKTRKIVRAMSRIVVLFRVRARDKARVVVRL